MERRPAAHDVEVASLDVDLFFRFFEVFLVTGKTDTLTTSKKIVWSRMGIYGVHIDSLLYTSSLGAAIMTSSLAPEALYCCGAVETSSSPAGGPCSGAELVPLSIVLGGGSGWKVATNDNHRNRCLIPVKLRRGLIGTSFSSAFRLSLLS